MDFLLTGSPVLETLGIQGYKKGALCLRLVGHCLQCVQICLSVVETIAVVEAPLLERLILWEPLDGSCIRLKIGHAPKLRILGAWNLHSGDAQHRHQFQERGELKHHGPKLEGPGIKCAFWSQQ